MTMDRHSIVLGTIAGNRLNLNGDQGNLLALKVYLEKAGFGVSVRSVSNTSEALACDFLLLGHGSMAAMDSIKSGLGDFDWKQILEVTPGLAVGSGFEWLAQEQLGIAISKSERVSEFRVGYLGSQSALGYRNTETDLPDITLQQQFICSMLHGPVLAKNPALLHRAALAAIKHAGVTFPTVTPVGFTEWVSHLNRICGQIWELESETPFQPLVVG